MSELEIIGVPQSNFVRTVPVLAYLIECPESGEALKAAKELAHDLDRHSERASFKATVPPPFSELRPRNP